MFSPDIRSIFYKDRKLPTIVLAGPDHSSRALEDLSDHVINQTVLVPDLVRLELLDVLPENVR